MKYFKYLKFRLWHLLVKRLLLHKVSRTQDLADCAEYKSYFHVAADARVPRLRSRSDTVRVLAG